MFLLDTNAVIAINSGRPPAVRLRNAAALASGATVAISALVAFELWYGVNLSQRSANNAVELRGFLSGPVETIPFDSEDAITAVEIRAHLKKTATPIGPYDVLIAAQALRRDATLITANLAEFTRVPGLKCLDWSAPGPSGDA